MQGRHSRIKGNKQIGSRNKFSPTSLTVTRRIGGSVQKNLVAAARVHFSRSEAAFVPHKPRRSQFKTDSKILQEDICRFIENEAWRIAKQQSFLGSEVTEHNEAFTLQALTVAFSSPKSTLEFLGRHRQINHAERQF